MSRTIEAASLVDLTIRDARLNDAAELAALTCELGYKTTSVEMATRLETVLKDARYKTFVAEIGGKLCGMIGTVSHSSYLHNSGRIIALVVSSKMRNCGLVANWWLRRKRISCGEKSRVSR